MTAVLSTTYNIGVEDDPDLPVLVDTWSELDEFYYRLNQSTTN